MAGPGGASLEGPPRNRHVSASNVLSNKAGTGMLGTFLAIAPHGGLIARPYQGMAWVGMSCLGSV